MSTIIVTGWGWAFGGDNGHSMTLFASFGPINGVAQATAATDGTSGGLYAMGFPTHTVRPTPDGGDQPVHSAWSDDYGWPALVADGHLASVTAELVVGGGGDESGSFVLNVFAW